MSSKYLSQEEIRVVVQSEHHDPFIVLGIHYIHPEKKRGIVIRFFNPWVTHAVLVEKSNNKEHVMTKIHDDGLYEIAFEKRSKFFAYKFVVNNLAGHTWDVEDPYRFLPVLGEMDLHLLKEGTDYNSYEHLGAHKKSIDGIDGTHFAVWAPSAKRVSVMGGFNNWDGRIHQMRVLGATGFWELFIPGVKEGDLYKFEIKTENNTVLQKRDPYATFSELAPNTASIVHDVNNYQWDDGAWMETRKARHALDAPISIYEVHLGSWAQQENGDFYNYRDVAERLVAYVKEIGYTHIELMPITEHPYYGSWGYQSIGYFSPTSRFGSPDDFKFFVDHCHKNDIGVILDWVPAHFPKDDYALAKFDGSALFEHSDPRQGEHQDWGTYIFNFGRFEVRNFLISSALFWLKHYHLDGLRVDAVASMLYLDYSRNDGEWVPNKYGGRENLEAIDFIKSFNEMVYKYFPDTMTIAEESTAWPAVSRPLYTGGLGFGYKWNMGWMHDILDYMGQDPVYRKYHHTALTFSLWYAFHENFILPFSHDEVVYGKGSMINKMAGDPWQKFANLRLLYLYMYTHPGKKLTFMGQEIGQSNEWNHDKGLDWHLLKEPLHQKLNYFVKDLHGIYKGQPALYEDDFTNNGFEWIEVSDSQQSIISYMRKGKTDSVITVLNFTPIVRESYRMGVPEAGTYEVIFNTDSEYYGGSNVGEAHPVVADETYWNNQPYSIELKLPPLGGMVLKKIK